MAKEKKYKAQKRTNMTQQEKVKQSIIYSVFYVMLVVMVIACVIPFIMVMMNATRTGMEIQGSTFSLTPGGSLKENYDLLLVFANVPRGFVNSLWVSLWVTLLSGYFSALTAYGFYLYKFKGNKTLFGIIIIFMMVPTQLAFIGFYQFMVRISLVDTFYPLILPAIASIGTVFFLRQYASATVHKEIVESARIDGSSELYTFHRIGIPLMMPGIATMSIFTFIGSWNNYLGARIILNSPDKFTLPLQIAQLRGSNVWFENQGALYVGLAFSVFPIMIVFIIFSRYLVDSIAAGAVKG